MKTGLPPIENENASLLILGSLPGDESILRQQYYAHPRNHFWPLIAALLKESLPIEYEERCSMLLRSNIALWDVLHAAERDGSLDSNIKNGQPNDLPAFIHSHSKLRGVILNGSAAARCYKKNFGTLPLPFAEARSTSPVPAKSGNTLEEKIVLWQMALQSLNMYALPL